MFNIILNLISFGLWAGVGVGAAAVGFVVLMHPAARRMRLAMPLATVCFCVASFCTGHIFNENGSRAKLRALQNEIADAQKRASELSVQAQERLRKINELQGIADEYAVELAQGASNYCPVDPVYSDRMRRILESATK